MRISLSKELSGNNLHDLAVYYISRQFLTAAEVRKEELRYG